MAYDWLQALLSANGVPGLTFCYFTRMLIWKTCDTLGPCKNFVNLIIQKMFALLGFVRCIICVGKLVYISWHCHYSSYDSSPDSRTCWCRFCCLWTCHCITCVSKALGKNIFNLSWWQYRNISHWKNTEITKLLPELQLASLHVFIQPQAISTCRSIHV